MRKHRVLLVEDEEILRSSLNMFLTRCGLEVEEAEGEKGAIAKIAGGDFGLVVTDLFLAEGSGFGIMKHLHECCPELKCIVITGHASIDSAITALRKGAFDYLLKPFEYDELKAAVENAFEKQSDERHIKKVDLQRIARDYGLTKKESQITKVVVTEGLSNEDLAARLKISKNTIKVHLRNIFKKVGVESKTALTTTVLSGGK